MPCDTVNFPTRPAEKNSLPLEITVLYRGDSLNFRRFAPYFKLARCHVHNYIADNTYIFIFLFFVFLLLVFLSVDLSGLFLFSLFFYGFISFFYLI